MYKSEIDLKYFLDQSKNFALNLTIFVEGFIVVCYIQLFKKKASTRTYCLLFLV